jgi:hypothetical protein
MASVVDADFIRANPAGFARIGAGLFNGVLGYPQPLSEALGRLEKYCRAYPAEANSLTPIAIFDRTD